MGFSTKTGGGCRTQRCISLGGREFQSLGAALEKALSEEIRGARW